MPASPTPAQSEASRQNGARSQGPATPEGKARSALNGTRHGLRGSTFTLLPGEDPAAWAALLAGYLARFRPADAAELPASSAWPPATGARAGSSASRPRCCSPAAATRPNPTRASAGRARCPATRPRSAATARRRWSNSRCCAPPPAATGRANLGGRGPDALAGRADRARGGGRAGDAGERHARTRGGRRACPETPVTAAAHASPNRVTPEPGPQRPLNRAERRRLAALARRTA